jgi:hypothetical protein
MLFDICFSYVTCIRVHVLDARSFLRVLSYFYHSNLSPLQVLLGFPLL